MKAKPQSRQGRIAAPEEVLARIEPGMSIFLGTGMAEPRTLMRHLLASDRPNLQDLELVQLISLGEAVAGDAENARRIRLKTFFSGWIASEAIRDGRADLIPSRFSQVPALLKSGAVHVDAAFLQISRPDAAGYATLGVGSDLGRAAMDRASFVVGEINGTIPRTAGDTLVHVNEFDALVEATDPPIYIPRMTAVGVHERIAAHIASVIENGSCIAFGIGPIYEALGPQLAAKRDLGIHTPFFTDALMDLMESGAVSNRRKAVFAGKSAACYALGTEKLLAWLDGNPRVEFQPLDVIMDPRTIGRNDRVITILPARKIDLTGNVALHAGKWNFTAGPGVVQEFFMGAAMSRRGRTIVALSSRNREGRPNILLSVDSLPFQFSNRESLDLVVTEFGVAYLMGRSLRERAQALIDIAHPDDRPDLVRQAKAAKILYPDQIYLAESARIYPERIRATRTLSDELTVRFRAIKPSDEDEMRRLFYRFSDQAVYYRYFSPIKAMPHKAMQEYVNIDYRHAMSLVGVVDEAGIERIIAEGRYVRHPDRPLADTAFVVDERFHGQGIATFLFEMLADIARERGIKGFTADVLVDNKAMMRVYEKAPFPVRAVLSSGVYELTLPFEEEAGGETGEGG